MLCLSHIKYLQKESKAIRHQFNDGRPSRSWGQHYIWPIHSINLDLKEARDVVSSVRAPDHHHWAKGLGSKLDSNVSLYRLVLLPIHLQIMVSLSEQDESLKDLLNQIEPKLDRISRMIDMETPKATASNYSQPSHP